MFQNQPQYCPTTTAAAVSSTAPEPYRESAHCPHESLHNIQLSLARARESGGGACIGEDAHFHLRCNKLSDRAKRNSQNRRFSTRTLKRAPTYIARIAMEHVPPYDDIYTDGLSRAHADHDVTI